MSQIQRHASRPADQEEQRHGDSTSSSLPDTHPMHRTPSEPEKPTAYPIPSRRDRYGQWPSKDAWYVAKIILRSLSVILAFAAFVLELILLLVIDTYSSHLGIPLWSGIVAVCILVTIWDVAEFITMCVRRGYGIAPRFHIGFDLVLILLAAIGLALAFLQLGFYGYGNWYYQGLSSDPSGTNIPTMTIFALLIIIHFILFVRAILDHRHGKGATPRIMYLPTGHAVVVLPRPYPPPPSVQALAPPGPVLPTATTTTITAAKEADQPASPPLEHAPSLPPPPGLKRKPIPKRGAHFAAPEEGPGPDHQPDEEEQRRAARGEAQAQWMAVDGAEIARVRRGGGPAEKFLAGERGTGSRRNSM